MGKALLVLGAAFILASSSMFFSGVNQGTISSVEQLGSHASRTLAREVAFTGIADAKHYIPNNVDTGGNYTGDSLWTGQYQGGTYTINISISASEFTVKSTGVHGDKEYVIVRVFQEASGESIPPFMAAALTTDSNLQISEDINIVAANPGENANVHSNDNIEITEGTAYIEGFGYHEANLQIGNGQSATDIFQPNVNPGGLPVTQSVDEITIPNFDPTVFSGIATSSSGNLDLSGSYALGTEENPTIWYVAGDVRTSDAVTLSGYGVIVATGDIKIRHDVTLLGAATESTLGLYTNGNIDLEVGHLNVGGQWYTNGNIHLADQTTFTGTMTAVGNFEFSGPVNVNYRQATSALTQPFWTSSSAIAGLIMVSSQEWAIE